jgi:hypothetical protein
MNRINRPDCKGTATLERRVNLWALQLPRDLGAARCKIFVMRYS